MLRTNSLSFSYDKNTSFVFPDISLKKGGNLLLLGNSGVGKTTLMHLLAGLLKPENGSVELMGKNLHEFKAADLDKFIGKHIGVVFQRPHFIKALTFKENLELIQYLAGLPIDKNRIKEVSDNLDLNKKLNKLPYQFSQGEQQRAAIALAVINKPDLILADEPTANLDDKNCQRVCDLLLKEATSTEAQLIIITHDQRLKNQFENKLEL